MLLLFDVQGTRIVLVWRIRGDILGNEPDDFSNVSISLDVSSRHEETNRTNNNLINGPIKIEYSAISDLDITRVYVIATYIVYVYVCIVQCTM